MTTLSELKATFWKHTGQRPHMDIDAALSAVLDALEGSVAEAFTNECSLTDKTAKAVARRWRNQFKEQSNG